MLLLTRAALAIIATLMLAAPVLACSCARNPTAEGLLRDSDAVFTGAVQDVRSIAPGVSITTFVVTESFKGPAAGATVQVRHPSGSSASCGVHFETGTSYTLAVYRGSHGLAATLCSAWMFLPQVGLGPDLIARMRALRGR